MPIVWTVKSSSDQKLCSPRVTNRRAVATTSASSNPRAPSDLATEKVETAFEAEDEIGQVPLVELLRASRRVRLKSVPHRRWASMALRDPRLLFQGWIPVYRLYGIKMAASAPLATLERSWRQSGFFCFLTLTTSCCPRRSQCW
jgi:hypothetical protein